MMPIAVGVRVGVGKGKEKLVKGPKIEIEYEKFLEFLIKKLRDRKFIEQLVIEGKRSEMFYPDHVREGIYPVDFDELYFLYLRRTMRKDLANLLDKIFTKWIFRQIKVDKNLEKLLEKIGDTRIRIYIVFYDGNEKKEYWFGKFIIKNFYNMIFSLPIGKDGFSIVDFFGERYLKISKIHMNPIGRVSILLDIPKDYDKNHTEIIFRKKVENIGEYKEILRINYWEEDYCYHHILEWSDRWKRWIKKWIGEINKKYMKIFEDFWGIENSLRHLVGYDKFSCERLGLKADKENKGEFYVIYRKPEGGKYKEYLFKFVYKFYRKDNREVLHFDEAIIYKKNNPKSCLRK